MKHVPHKYCLNCTARLTSKKINGIARLVCSNKCCGFILWNNPTPVVGGIIETSNGIVLAHNKLWKKNTQLSPDLSNLMNHPK